MYAVDFATDERELRPAGAPLVAPERFSRLCWGSIGLDTEAFPVRPARPCHARARARSRLPLDAMPSERGRSARPRRRAR